MNAQISIVLPIYNVENYLNQCLNTIVGKHEELIEILLVDDGSTDSSGVIADQFANNYKNIKVYHKLNGGLSDARNYGLNQASGQYVFFLDSDDFVTQDALDIMLSTIADQELDIVLWDADLYDEDGKKADKNADYYHHMGVMPGFICSGKEVIEKQIEYRNDYVTTVWLGLYNRKFLLRNNLWFEKGLLHEDEMWSQKVLIAAEHIIYVNHALYCYRLRKNSIMHQANIDYSKNVSCLIYIFTSLMTYYEWKIEDDNFKRMLTGNVVKRFLHMIGRYEVSKYPELRKRINRKQLFLNANTKRDKLRAFVLMISISLYCKIMKNTRNRSLDY